LAEAESGLSPETRIVGLDAWRVMLMLGGFLLHASYWQPSQPLFTVVWMFSHSFRMGSFFAISGYLCGLSMRKRPPKQWLVRRLVQIGLPTLFGCSLLCPLIWILVRWYPQVPVPPVFDLHHIWFLVALLVYAPTTLLLNFLEQRYRLIGRFAEQYSTRRSLMPMLLTVAMVSLILSRSTELLMIDFVPAHLVAILPQAPIVVGYLPEYLVGAAMAGSVPLALAVQRSWRSALAIVLATAIFYVLSFMLAPVLGPPRQVLVNNLVVMVAASLCPPATFALIFRSAVAIRRVPMFVHRVCDASLTIYLLHLPLLLVANAVLAPAGLHPYVQYALAILSAGVVSYSAHVWIVRPVPLLLVIVNGRIDRWRLPAAWAQTVELRQDIGARIVAPAIATDQRL
jgi:glucan biosynthesis protein C